MLFIINVKSKNIFAKVIALTHATSTSIHYSFPQIQPTFTLKHSYQSRNNYLLQTSYSNPVEHCIKHYALTKQYPYSYPNPANHYNTITTIQSLQYSSQIPH